MFNIMSNIAYISSSVSCNGISDIFVSGLAKESLSLQNTAPSIRSNTPFLCRDLCFCFFARGFYDWQNSFQTDHFLYFFPNSILSLVLVLLLSFSSCAFIKAINVELTTCTVIFFVQMLEKMVSFQIHLPLLVWEQNSTSCPFRFCSVGHFKFCLN